MKPNSLKAFFMILTEEDILYLIENPSNTNIKDWRKHHNTLDIYLNGGEVYKELEKVKNYENEEQKKLRDSIARSTKDLMSYLLNPINKVFSASGFNSEIEFKVESINESFKKHLDELPEGISLRKWMKNYWLESFITDPNGVILVESETDGDKPRSYPTYKSINVIHDYKIKWDKFQYIILLHKKARVGDDEVQVYRVYDELQDALYYVKNGKLFAYGNTDENNEHKEAHSVPNKIGEIPAVLVSDIIEKKTGGKKSFIDKIDEVLKEYMRDSSVHSIYKFLHGFPIYWAYAMKCATCQGTGRVENLNKAEGQPANKECPTCKGKRLQVAKDVSDGIRLPLPQGGDDPKLAPDIAGYVTPDLETWKMQLDEMHEMKKDMFYALWGTSIVEEQGTQKTATEVYINKQPMNDTLDSISTTAEAKETKIINYMANMMHPEQASKLRVYWGRRYMIETPDILWDRYITAKTKNAPQSTLDYLYEQFLQAEYHNDANMLDKKLKEFYLEPFVHYSIIDLNGIATQEQIQRKLIFSDWIMMMEDFTKDENTLRIEFENYFKSKYNENTATV